MQLPGSYFLPFFKMRVIFSFFLSSGTCAVAHLLLQFLHLVTQGCDKAHGRPLLPWPQQRQQPLSPPQTQTEVSSLSEISSVPQTSAPVNDREHALCCTETITALSSSIPTQSSAEVLCALAVLVLCPC